MIRKYKLSKALPRKRILEVAGEIGDNWHQSINLPVDLVEYFVSQAPQFKSFHPPSVVMHTTRGSIYRHRDCLARSVFVFPVKFGKTTEFVVGDYVEQTVRFEPGFMYRFNDFEYHGVFNPNYANLILVTVSFECQF